MRTVEFRIKGLGVGAGGGGLRAGGWGLGAEGWGLGVGVDLSDRTYIRSGPWSNCSMSLSESSKEASTNPSLSNCFRKSSAVNFHSCDISSYPHCVTSGVGDPVCAPICVTSSCPIGTETSADLSQPSPDPPLSLLALTLSAPSTHTPASAAHRPPPSSLRPSLSPSSSGCACWLLAPRLGFDVTR
jgi:hypothetical protein